MYHFQLTVPARTTSVILLKIPKPAFWSYIRTVTFRKLNMFLIVMKVSKRFFSDFSDAYNINFIKLFIIISGSRVLDAFNYERDTQVAYSCSVVMAGKMWVFGGIGDFQQQLSSVAKCHLKTEGKLPFNLYKGAANTVEGFNAVQTTILCFHYNSPYKSCHS